MKSKMRLVLIVVFALLCLSACSSSEDSPERYLSGFTAGDYIELPDILLMEIDVEMEEITDEDVTEFIEASLSSELVEVTSRTDVQNGDVVNIDYTGKIDGEEFDGGSAEGYDLEIGSGTFIDGFEDGLVGCNVGEAVDIELTFPEDYSYEDVAGKDCVFTVTINSISEYQAEVFNDAWVQDRGLGLKTTEEYEEYIYEYLYDDAYDDYVSEIKEEAAAWLVDNCTILKTLPSAYVGRTYDEMYSYYDAYAEYYGMDIEEFMVYYCGGDADEPLAVLEDAAYESALRSIVLQAFADEYELNLTENEKTEYIETYAEYYGYESAEEFEEAEDINSFLEFAMTQKVYEYLGNLILAE